MIGFVVGLKELGWVVGVGKAREEMGGDDGSLALVERRALRRACFASGDEVMMGI